MDMGAGKASILVVEDEWIIASDLKGRLEGMGFEVCAIVASGEEAIKEACSLRPSLVLMDIALKGDVDGIEAAAKILSACDIPVVYLSALTDDETLQRAMLTEPYGFLSKPFDELQLRLKINTAIYRHAADSARANSQKLLEPLFKALPDPLMVFDSSGTVVQANDSACSLLGYPEGGLNGLAAEAVAPSLPTEGIKALLKAGPASETGLGETFLRRADGTDIPVQSGMAVFEHQGKMYLQVLARESNPSSGRSAIRRKEKAAFYRPSKKPVGKETLTMPLCVSRKGAADAEAYRLLVRKHRDAVLREGHCRECLDLIRRPGTEKDKRLRH